MGYHSSILQLLVELDWVLAGCNVVQFPIDGFYHMRKAWLRCVVDAILLRARLVLLKYLLVFEGRVLLLD